MDVWERQYDEPIEKYELFSSYLDLKVLSKVAKESKNDLSSIKIWAKKYSWEDRAEAYYRNEEKLTKIERANSIKESAYGYIEDLQKQMNALSLTTQLYHKALREGGLQEIESLPILEKRALSIEDTELKLKTLKQYKEVLELTPEGRDLLQSGESSGQVVIEIKPADMTSGKIIEVKHAPVVEPKLIEE